MSDRVEKNEVELEENQAKTKLKNFNFAAFIMPHIWGIGNGVYIGLLALIPILYPFVGFYLGFFGNELAFYKKYQTEEKFYKNQRCWAFAAIVYIIAIIALLVVRFYGNYETYKANKKEQNRLIEKTENEMQALEEKYDILTSEEYLSEFCDDIIAKPLVEYQYAELGVWELEERYDFTDLCKEKINFEEPVIYWIKRCYELEDGKIIWIYFRVEDNTKIVESRYSIVPSCEETSLEIEMSLDSKYIIEEGTYMDLYEMNYILGIHH